MTLNGDSSVTISQHGFFSDPGAFSDGGEAITVTGTVDFVVPGTYTITYTAVDEAGNVGSVTREVIVTGGNTILNLQHTFSNNYAL